MDTTNKPRCINLDWLEVHCLEPNGEPHDAEYFRRLGFVVEERAYGTRVYRQMFTIMGNDGLPFVEVRRDPASQGINGLFSPEDCHLRLSNRACYLDDAAELLSEFIACYNYKFCRIVRVDICLDFDKFDSGDDPQRFLQRYIQQKYSKINQGNIHAHGTDTWSSLNWNSVSWGSPTSDIGTKMYNKTMELYNPKDNSYSKPYIRYAWLKCGLIDDMQHCTKMVDGNSVTAMIWRVEFSIRSSVKRWFVIELNGKSKAYQSIQNTLDMYSGRDRLITIFASLCNHYFHFKYLIKRYDFYKNGHTSGEAIRKDRCPDKILFKWDNQQYVYKVGRENAQIGDGHNQVRPLNSLINKIREYKLSHYKPEIHRACDILLEAMQADNIRADMTSPWNYVELKALQLALQTNLSHPSPDVTVLLREIKEFLRINDNTAVF